MAVTTDSGECVQVNDALADRLGYPAGALLGRRLEDLATAGAAFRRAEARVLHEQALSMEAIGALFGVTRQRVSVLLKQG